MVLHATGELPLRYIHTSLDFRQTASQTDMQACVQTYSTHTVLFCSYPSGEKIPEKDKRIQGKDVLLQCALQLRSWHLMQSHWPDNYTMTHAAAIQLQQGIGSCPLSIL